MAGMLQLNAFFVNFATNAVNFTLWNLIPAIIVLLIGYIVGKVIGIIIQRLAVAGKIDKHVKLKGFKLSNLLRLAGEWIIYLLFILQATVILGVPEIGSFVRTVVYFIPQAVEAAIIIIVGYVLGGFFEEQIKGTEGMYKDVIGKVVHFFTVYVAIALALPFLGIDPSLVNNILLIIIASVGLGVAIALGLGLKDIVARESEKYIGEFKKSTKSRRKKK